MELSNDSGLVLMDDRRPLRITSNRLCRPSPATVEQRVCRQDLGLFRLALPHHRDKLLDRLGGVLAGQLAHLDITFRAAAGVATLAGQKWSTHDALSGLCSQCSIRLTLWARPDR